ncbi:MAG: hypothetical protein ABW048_09120 [Sphingobium sp.]
MNNPTTLDRNASDDKRDRKAPKNQQDKPLDQEEKLEAGLEDSMDASDPPSVTAPGDHGDPVPSSGYHEDDADDRAEGKS